MRGIAFATIVAALLASGGLAWADSLTATDFHGNPARSGNYVVPGLTWAMAATVHPLPGWTGNIQGPVHAQPLYYHPRGAANGLIIVASDHDVVQALDSVSGHTLWTSTLGPPVPPENQPCGNPGKWTDVGTPVIDDAAGALYVAESVLSERGNIVHRVYGLSLSDGSVLPGWPVDIKQGLAAKGKKFVAAAQAQRGALALVGRTLYVPYGGGDGGDCLPYHGWVIGLNVATPGVSAYWETRGQWGGLWAQGGVTYDGISLFVATANTRKTTVWRDGEAILRLQSGLRHSSDTHDFFTPSNWLKLDNTDLDLGGTGPLPINVPIAGGGTAAWMLALGKDGNAYLLDRTNLGGIGRALLVQQIANDHIRTSAATYPASDGVFVTMKANGANCPQPAANVAVTTIKVMAQPSPAISTVWCASLIGTGTPIVTTSDGASNAIVWMVGSEGDAQLHGFRGDTGQPLFAGSPATNVPDARRYVTPLAAEGRLYVATDNKIFAFSFGP